MKQVQFLVESGGADTVRCRDKDGRLPLHVREHLQNDYLQQVQYLHGGCLPCVSFIPNFER